MPPRQPHPIHARRPAPSAVVIGLLVLLLARDTLTSGNVNGGVLRELKGGPIRHIGSMFCMDFNYGAGK
jgi:hypothetical protein